MAATFGTTYPETLFRKSVVVSAASHGGFMCQNTLASVETFEGTVEHSTKDTLKKQLADNVVIHQTTIDNHLPPDQSQHAQSHVVFLAILRRGYFQATGVLDYILPFYRLLTRAGFVVKDSWENKILTYVMSIC